MSGMRGRPPVAMHALLNLSLVQKSSVQTMTEPSESKEALPMKTSTPSFFANRSAASLTDIPARTSRTRCITFAKSTLTSPVNSMPSSLSFSLSANLAASFALRISALLGTHPVFKQSPPIHLISTIATFAPTPAAPAAVTSPPAPAPTTTISYRAFGVGLTQPRGCTLLRSSRLAGSSGKREKAESASRVSSGVESSGWAGREKEGWSGEALFPETGGRISFQHARCPSLVFRTAPCSPSSTNR
mmetsp:Transcript_5136/g.12379  ORF Transcript_5136/g.12379 Transcript_5136/m.12379 type:complete len:245 (+) Transcript_5136:1347-2081(+)